MQPSNEMLERLRMLAARKTMGDDQAEATKEGRDLPFADDYAAGNIDDAYDKGNSDGETELARAILGDLARGE